MGSASLRSRTRAILIPLTPWPVPSCSRFLCLCGRSGVGVDVGELLRRYGDGGDLGHN